MVARSERADDLGKLGIAFHEGIADHGVAAVFAATWIPALEDDEVLQAFVRHMARTPRHYGAYRDGYCRARAQRRAWRKRRSPTRT